MPDDPLITLRAIAADPYADWTRRYPDRHAIGTFCTYAPAEILHAAGFVPVRLVPAGVGGASADRHLQTYTCAVARGVLAAAIAGCWDWLAGVVFPHTCDTVQALADVWHEVQPSGPSTLRPRSGQATSGSSYVGTLVGPVAVEAPAAESYLVAELRRFIADLEAHYGVTVSDAALRASIQAYNENRRLLAALREPLPYSDWLRAALAGLSMPVEEHTRLLTILAESPPHSRSPRSLTEAQGLGQKPRPTQGAKVLLVGAVLDDPALPVFIEELGGSIADDDLCTGRRGFETLVDEGCADPVVALARRELHRPPCPARYAPSQPRPARLLRLVQESQTDGVIFLQQKFCEPHAFDLPPLRAALDEVGVPHLTLDMEGSAIDGALQTRVQAFLEMLQ